MLAVPLLWPEGTTYREAKVRVWTEAGVAPTLLGGPVWRPLGLETADGHKAWPALVAAATGPEVELQLALDSAGENRLPLFVAEHTLAQVQIGTDGSQAVRLCLCVASSPRTAWRSSCPCRGNRPSRCSASPAVR